MLPILFTKTGKGSNIACLEVVNKDEIAIYKPDRTSRILLSANEGTQNTSIKIQKLNNNIFVDNVIISDESIDSNVEYATLHGSLIPPLVTYNFVSSEHRFMSSDRLILSEGTWNSNMSSYDQIIFDVDVKFTNIKSIRMGAGSKIMFGKVNSVFYDWEKDISNVSADMISKGKIRFMFYLGKIDSELSSGEYCFYIKFDSLIRTGVGGNDHEENFDNNKDITVANLHYGLFQNITFTKTSDTDNMVTKIGSDGIKISVNSATSFIVKNNGEELNIVATGLPTQPPSTPGSIYVSDDTLKITQ
jgi:hypothetical protein